MGNLLKMHHEYIEYKVRKFFLLSINFYHIVIMLKFFIHSIYFDFYRRFIFLNLFPAINVNNALK